MKLSYSFSFSGNHLIHWLAIRLDTLVIKIKEKLKIFTTVVVNTRDNFIFLRTIWNSEVISGRIILMLLANGCIEPFVCTSKIPVKGAL